MSVSQYLASAITLAGGQAALCKSRKRSIDQRLYHLISHCQGQRHNCRNLLHALALETLKQNRVNTKSSRIGNVSTRVRQSFLPFLSF